MFFYSPHAKSSASGTSIRRQTLTPASQLHIGQIDTRLSVHIADQLYREGQEEQQQQQQPQGSSSTPRERDSTLVRYFPDEFRLEDALQQLFSTPQIVHHDWQHQQQAHPVIDDTTSPSVSVFSTCESRRTSRGTHSKIYLRRPTISVEDGRVIIGE